MKINFRQGIVSFQSGGFLQVNGSNVDLLASNRGVTVSLAHHDTNYTHSEDNTVASAWVGPFTEPNYYLYWDFNQSTFNRTFGHTTLEPVAQSVQPGNGNTPVVGVVPGIASPAFGSFEVDGQYILAVDKPFAIVGSTANDSNYTVQSATYNSGTGTTTIVVNEEIPDATVDGEVTLDIDVFGNPLELEGRSWFDTANNVHYVYNSLVWTEVLRVYAAQLFNGTTFIPLSMTGGGDFSGTQIGNNNSVFTGRVLFGETGNTIRRDDGTFFTTEDQFFTNQSRVDALRLEANVTRAQSITGGTLAAFGIVAWTADGQITSATYEDTGSTVVGILTETLNYQEVGAVIVQGTVTNPAWTWTTGVDAVDVGSELWIMAGELTAIDPHVADPITYPFIQVPVARVLSVDTVIFEQGLGGVGPQGPIGTVTEFPLAAVGVNGIVSLSHAPDDAGIPIAASVTHPVLSDGPYAAFTHQHPASQITYTPGNGISSDSVQNAINELALEKLNLAGGNMTGILVLSASPTSNFEAATKAYVDSVAAGLDAKEACLVGTVADFGGTYLSTGGTGGTGNITTALVASLDGTANVDFILGVDSRILVKDQTDDFENGIYVVTALGAGSPPTTVDVERSSDFDENDDIRAGNYTVLRSGLTQAGQGWVLTDIHPTDDIELNAHPITWTLVSTAATGPNWVYANGGADFTITPLAVQDRAIAIGNNASTGYKDSIAIGTNATSTNYGVSIGLDSDVLSTGGVAIGQEARSLSGNGVAVGYSATATTSFDIAMGRNSTTSAGNSSIAIGNSANTSGTQSISFGYNSDTAEANQISIGSRLAAGSVTTDVPFSVKLGNSATVGQDNFLHLFSKGKLELYGDEAQFVLPNYAVGVGSPIAVTLPPTTIEGGMVWDATEKKPKVYAGSPLGWIPIPGNGIENVVEDLTPQLGGDLDTNGYNIVTAANAVSSSDSITIRTGNVSSAGGSTSGNISIKTGYGYSGNAGGYITLKAGYGTTTSDGGYITMYGGGGYGSGNGGWFRTVAGDSSGGTAGYVFMGAGSTTGGIAGYVELRGGSAGAGGTAGPVRLRGGFNNNAGEDGADVSLQAGNGGDNGGNIVLSPGGGTAVADGNVQLHSGVGGIGQASVQLWDDTNIGHTTGNYVALKAPLFAGSPPANVTYTLPELDGSSGDALQTDGAGNLSFVTPTVPVTKPSYERFDIAGSPVAQVLNTTVSTIATSGGVANLQVFRNGILQNEGDVAGSPITNDFEVTGPNQITFAPDSLQDGGVVIIYVFN